MDAAAEDTATGTIAVDTSAGGREAALDETVRAGRPVRAPRLAPGLSQPRTAQRPDRASAVIAHIEATAGGKLGLVAHAAELIGA